MAFTVRTTPVRATKAVVLNKPFVQQPEVAAAQAARLTVVRAEPEDAKDKAEDAIDGFKSEIREVAEGAKEKADEGAVALEDVTDEAKDAANKAVEKGGSVQFDE